MQRLLRETDAASTPSACPLPGKLVQNAERYCLDATIPVEELMSIVDPQAFWNLLAGMSVCMLVTRDGATLRSRPMAPNVDAAQEEIRFQTRRSSHKVDEIDDIGEVNVAFVDTGREDYVSVSGMAWLSQDRGLIRAIWTPEDDTSFPEGPDGPDIAAIRVRPTMAEYWDATGGERRYAWLSFHHARGRTA